MCGNGNREAGPSEDGIGRVLLVLPVPILWFGPGRAIPSSRPLVMSAGARSGASRMAH